MTAVSLLKTPLLSVDRGPRGAVHASAPGNIGGVPLTATLTEGEIHIGWVDRNGPAFVIELNPLVKAAIDEIEALIGQRKEGRT